MPRSDRFTSRRGLSCGSAFVRVFVATALVAGVLVSGAVPSGAAARWSVAPSVSPPGPPLGDLSAVSCSTPTDCFAVGAGLFEHWNGTAWSIVAGVVGSLDDELNGISCSSPTSCFAVGDVSTETETSFTAKPLIERWNGVTWSTVAGPALSGTTDAFLNGVSCSSATDCFAVGGSSDSPVDSDQFTGTALLEHWDGTTWSVVSSPAPGDAFESELLGVSCLSPISCFAVGDFQSPAIGGALVERWDGATWSIAANPDSSFATKSGTGRRLLSGFKRSISRVAPQQIAGFSDSPGLQGVSCASTTSCFAVGVSFAGALVERFDGSTWANVTTPTPPNTEGADLGSVSCVTSTDCSAVGIAGAASGSGGIIDVEEVPLQEHWNGLAWSVVPGASGAPVSELSSVSCASASACFAVGDSAIVERWNGSSWSLSPFGTVTSQSQLNHVACPSPTLCFAVGSFESNVQSDTLVERWNGSTWSKVASPTPGGSFIARLSGVSCASPTACMAVGAIASDLGEQTLIERWNGQKWAIVASPNPTANGPEISQLTDVACPAANNCLAVGLTESETGAATLAEHWNGRAWSIVATPTLSGAIVIELIGVSCVTTSDCTAVGTVESLQGTRTPGAQVLIEHWDGKAWSIVPSPSPKGAPFAALGDVSCSGPTNCLAVGFDASSTLSALHVLSERWNGKTWSVVTVPVPKGASNAELVGVSCRSAASCYAVGDTGTKTLVEHWNGSRWSIVPSATPLGTTQVELSGVSCPTASTCVAVGRYSARDSIFTLAELGS